MADLTEYITQKYTKLIGEITADLGRTADKLSNTQNILRALKNPDMLVDGAPMTLERLQVMESGDPKILPPTPVPLDTCEKEASKRSNTHHIQNGQKKETAVAELAEVANAS